MSIQGSRVVLGIAVTVLDCQHVCVVEGLPVASVGFRTVVLMTENIDVILQEFGLVYRQP
jgi:hypothetical protein